MVSHDELLSLGLSLRVREVCGLEPLGRFESAVLVVDVEVEAVHGASVEAGELRKHERAIADLHVRRSSNEAFESHYRHLSDELLIREQHRFLKLRYVSVVSNPV